MSRKLGPAAPAAPGSWLENQESSPIPDPLIRICLLIIPPGANESMRSITIAHLVFPPQDLCTCSSLCLAQSSFILDSRGPTYSKLIRCFLRKGSLDPPITSFSIKSPVFFFIPLLQCVVANQLIECLSPRRLRPCRAGLPGT